MAPAAGRPGRLPTGRCCASRWQHRPSGSGGAGAGSGTPGRREQDCGLREATGRRPEGAATRREDVAVRAPARRRRHGWARAPGGTAGAGQPGGVAGAGALESRRRPTCQLASRERCRRDAVEWEGRERTPRTGETAILKRS
ncbi:hypothetical protein OsI_08094 [Oryza sativa Indica Group]|uniref:Uncharacterized protein n=1 Tax=Oryza sativa subsp. indica TaxID=39946 RepID=A2X7A0_ORYSI|nr:hypothetical protein OsI_08094 [Oryza sativa Indica Group]